MTRRDCGARAASARGTGHFSAQTADINADGMCDFFDVQIYLGLFSQGCP